MSQVKEYVVVENIDMQNLTPDQQKLLDQWQQEYMDMYGINEDFLTLGNAEKIADIHRQCKENLGNIIDTWVDEYGDVCIEYDSNIWFHYTREADGCLGWY